VKDGSGALYDFLPAKTKSQAMTHGNGERQKQAEGHAKTYMIFSCIITEIQA
jgi:hypothetical protein